MNVIEYYARSQNADGIQETVYHHLKRTGDLCEVFTEEFSCPNAGQWMGLLHDFGKYSATFQEVLQHKRCHVDHAMPGAAMLSAKLCGRNWERSAYWPMVVAVRCHHGRLQYDLGAEIRAWSSGAEYSADGCSYSLTSKCLPKALTVFQKEIGLPAVAPVLQSRPTDPSKLVANLQKMLLTRMLFSALTDADYSASAEHFFPTYLEDSSIPPIDPMRTYECLEQYRKGLSATNHASSGITQLRNKVYDACCAAGKMLDTGVYTLTAPTGAGKTLAMLAFALQQMIHHEKKRIILVLPYLSIIEQNTAVYRKIIPDILEDHSQAERDGEFARELSQRWQAPFVITTSVKFFESLFSCSGPACRKLHSLANSVILFDEAQSLPVQLAQTTLLTLSELSAAYGATVVFSTATQPDFDQLPGISWQPKELLPHTQEMFKKAKRVQTRWQFEQPVSLEQLAEEMTESEEVCMIVNLRKHATKAYDALCRYCNPDDVYLMTTDLCPAHRTRILQEIREKLRSKKPCYLIATQCIEAGVDLSFDVLYRALGPLESIIQAAGRCNRSDSTRRGRFTVFLPDEETLYPDDFYRQAANAVLTLSARHEIDLNNLEHIREYYKILYGNGQVQQKQDLQTAISRMDFVGVAKAYRLIEDTQYQVLVPMCGQEALFTELAEEGRKDGVTPGWMRRAAPLLVHSYEKQLVQNTCERLFAYSGIHHEKTDTGCFVLCNASMYDDKTGLRLSEHFDGII